jgi:hypothetical protein
MNTHQPSAMADAQQRDAGRSRRTALLRHPLLWTQNKVLRRKGLSLRYPVTADANEIVERFAAMPVSVWTYGYEHPSVRHLGPMSQDFAAAFGLGTRDRVIDMVDANGVMTVVAQTLLRRVAKLEARIAELESAAP